MTPEQIRRVLWLNYDKEGPRVYLTAKVPLDLMPPMDGTHRRVKDWFHDVGGQEMEKTPHDWPVVAYLYNGILWAKAFDIFIHEKALYIRYCVKPHAKMSVREFCDDLSKAVQEAALCNRVIEVPEKALSREDLGVPDDPDIDYEALE